MARFVRHREPEDAGEDRVAGEDRHPDLVSRVQAYCPPMVPDRDSVLSLREQHLSGFLFNRRGMRIPSEGAAKH